MCFCHLGIILDAVTKKRKKSQGWRHDSRWIGFALSAEANANGRSFFVFLVPHTPFILFIVAVILCTLVFQKGHEGTKSMKPACVLKTDVAAKIRNERKILLAAICCRIEMPAALCVI